MNVRFKSRFLSALLALGIGLSATSQAQTRGAEPAKSNTTKPVVAASPFGTVRTPTTTGTDGTQALVMGGECGNLAASLAATITPTPAAPLSIKVGDAVKLTTTVTNLGTANACPFTMETAIPAGLTPVKCEVFIPGPNPANPQAGSQTFACSTMTATNASNKINYLAVYNKVYMNLTTTVNAQAAGDVTVVTMAKEPNDPQQSNNTASVVLKAQSAASNFGVFLDNKRTTPTPNGMVAQGINFKINNFKKTFPANSLTDKVVIIITSNGNAIFDQSNFANFVSLDNKFILSSQAFSNNSITLDIFPNQLNSLDLNTIFYIGVNLNKLSDIIVEVKDIKQNKIIYKENLIYEKHLFGISTQETIASWNKLTNTREVTSNFIIKNYTNFSPSINKFDISFLSMCASKEGNSYFGMPISAIKPKGITQPTVIQNNQSGDFWLQYLNSTPKPMESFTGSVSYAINSPALPDGSEMLGSCKFETILFVDNACLQNTATSTPNCRHEQTDRSVFGQNPDLDNNGTPLNDTSINTIKF